MGKVYVLGAGASKALNDGAPTMWQLNKRVFEAIQSSGHHRLERLREFIHLFYPDLPTNEVILLEEVLTLLDANINDDRPLTAQYSVQKLRELRENFIYVIGFILKNSLGTSQLKDEWEWLDFRAKTILPFLNSLNSEDSIITLNYDLILDNRIAECLFHGEIYKTISPAPQGGISDDVNYGFHPRYALMGPSQKRDYHPYEFVPIHKLHGSLNWLYCPSCRQVDISLGHKGVLHYALEDSVHSRCRYCGVRYEPLIITPTLMKSYTNPYIAQIWRQAETSLTQAEEIIFVGYSMPDADIVLRTVFSRAIFVNRTLKKRKPKIILVDTQADDSQLVKNYRRIFGDIKYFGKGFVEYIQERI